MFLFVRHGQRADLVANPPPIKILFDAQLTETGKQQATATGKYLAKYLYEKIQNPIIYVYTSPFLRVMQTAARIATQIGLQKIQGGCLRVSNAICQHLYGAYYQSHPINKINLALESKETILNQIGNVPYTQDYQLEFGTPQYPEDALQLYKRFGVSIEKYFDKHFDSKKVQEGVKDEPQQEENKTQSLDERKRTILIMVSHGASVESMARYTNDKNFKQDWPYCCISELIPVFDKDGKVIAKKNGKTADDSHLNQ